jgi:hypothetical protein
VASEDALGVAIADADGRDDAVPDESGVRVGDGDVLALALEETVGTAVATDDELGDTVGTAVATDDELGDTVGTAVATDDELGDTVGTAVATDDELGDTVGIAVATDDELGDTVGIAVGVPEDVTVDVGSGDTEDDCVSQADTEGLALTELVGVRVPASDAVGEIVAVGDREPVAVKVRTVG